MLVVDDEEAILASLRFALEDHFEVYTATGPSEAIRVAQCRHLDVCLVDLRLGDDDGMDLLDTLRTEQPGVGLVVMTAYASVRSAVECMKKGAHDYVTKPLDVDEIKVVLLNAAENSRIRRRLRRLETELERQYGPGGLVGQSPAMHQVFKLIEKAKWIDSNVLVLGESGTGKELVARALHYTGKRRHGPFEAVNCSAIPSSLLESELFGYEKGAFTGAVRRKPGRIEAADGGTLLLDEIGEMDISSQAKLLRVIEDQCVVPLGGISPRKVDVRFIAATNKDLAQEVNQGRFREDLYYRLNVVTIKVPALRERREDIPLLVHHFLHMYSDKLGRATRGITPRAMAVLQSAEYRGNVRELEHAVERALALKDPGDDSPIDVPDLPDNLASQVEEAPAVGGRDRTDKPVPGDFIPFAWGDTLKDLERRAIMETLRRTGGKKRLAAQMLGISERCLRNKLAGYRARRQ